MAGVRLYKKLKIFWTPVFVHSDVCPKNPAFVHSVVCPTPAFGVEPRKLFSPLVSFIIDLSNIESHKYAF